MTFANKLRNLRIARGMTQMELAEKLDSAQATIAFYESGKREPDFKTIQKIADFFGVPAYSLYPSPDNVDEVLMQDVTESLHQNPKLRTLFDKSKNLSDSDLDAILVMINAITRERGD